MDGEFAGRQRHLKEAAARGRTAEARELLLARDETLWRDGVDAQKTSLLAASLSSVPTTAQPNECLRWLLEELRLDPNQKSPIGGQWSKHPFELLFDGLHFCVPSVAEERVRLLVKAGADVNAVFHCNFAPLSHAIKSIEDNGPVMQVLLAAGAKTETLFENYNWNSPIFRGTKGNLVLHKATALHLAAAAHAVDSVCALLDFGADAFLKDSAGRTPAQVANLRSGPDVALLRLLEAPPAQRGPGVAKAVYEKLLAAARAACDPSSVAPAPAATSSQQSHEQLRQIELLRSKLKEAQALADSIQI